MFRDDSKIRSNPLFDTSPTLGETPKGILGNVSRIGWGLAGLSQGFTQGAVNGWDSGGIISGPFLGIYGAVVGGVVGLVRGTFSGEAGLNKTKRFLDGHINPFVTNKNLINKKFIKENLSRKDLNLDDSKESKKKYNEYLSQAEYFINQKMIDKMEKNTTLDRYHAFSNFPNLLFNDRRPSYISNEEKKNILERISNNLSSRSIINPHSKTK